MRYWKRTFALLAKCWKVVILFEILYRLFSRYIVFPTLRWLFNSALRVTGLYYLTAENLGRVLTQPVMLACILALFIVFALTAVIEVSCLITCLHSTRSGGTYGIFQVIIEGARDSIRLLRPRNLIILLGTALLIPILQLPTSTSMLRLIDLPWSALAEIMAHMPYSLLGWAYIAILLNMLLWIPCTFQYYVLEDIPAREACQRAFRLNRSNRLRTLLGIVVCIVLGCVVAFGGTAFLSHWISRALNALTDDANLQYRVRLPFDVLFSFIKSSLPSVLAFSYLSGVYYDQKETLNEPLPGQRMPFLTDAAHYNTITFTAVLLICLCSIILYDTVLRPTLVRIDAFSLLADRPTLIIAHRGDTHEADENTMGAFRAAIDIGVDYIELDVQLTSDGEIIVNHDNSYRRVFRDRHRVWELSLEETRALQSVKTGEYPPTLREVLTECDPQANFIVELKSNGHDMELPQKVFDLMTELECFDRCIIQSSSYKMLRDFKALSPDTRCGYILSFALGQFISLDAADFFSLDSSFVSENTLKRIHAVDKSLYVWTVNDDALMTDMLALGVDGIITDDAPQAKNTLLSLRSSLLDGLITEPIDNALSYEEEEPIEE
ncbi:MAG: glycerophosphoryl diester phosphodiesterase membrane domain-containing protein [Clostridia bacterium]|nr:glycerophosphoryl diester phosphodiesterase membrane domain-containing protein [Clostridia bacterium]